MQKKIVVNISNDGQIQIETHGYVGEECLEESKFIEEFLGKEISTQLTPAFYQSKGNKGVVKKHIPLCG
jgi:hypothetical protein